MVRNDSVEVVSGQYRVQIGDAGDGALSNRGPRVQAGGVQDLQAD